MPLPLASPAAAEEKPATVVEMFTSQGCANCPKANALLEHGLQRVKRIPFERALRASTTHPHDYLGAYTSESLGDYCAGPNHVLPTSGTARFSSPLGVYDFQKRSSLIEVSEQGAQTLGRIAAELAYGEGLHAHARAAEFRLKGEGA